MSTYRNSANHEAKALPNGKFKTPASVIRYTNSLKGRLGCLVKGAKASAKVKRLEFSLTTADVMWLWINQNGKCLYTGWEMTTETRSKNLVSLERKNCDEGYTRENCILVCWRANRARSLLDKDEFIELCVAVAMYCQQDRE